VTFDFPDGSVQYTTTSKLTGPAQEGGLCYGTSYLWFRVGGGEWRQSGLRNLAKVMEWMRVCESAAEVLELEGLV
jgi:hypothetical protein